MSSLNIRMYIKDIEALKEDLEAAEKNNRLLLQVIIENAIEERELQLKNIREKDSHEFYQTLLFRR